MDIPRWKQEQIEHQRRVLLAREAEAHRCRVRQCLLEWAKNEVKTCKS